MTVIRMETNEEVREIPKRLQPWFYEHSALMDLEDLAGAMQYIISRAPKFTHFFVGEIFGGIWADNHPPLEPIYETFLKRYPRADPKLVAVEAGKWLGLLVLQCQIDSDEEWHVFASDVTKREFKVSTYFKKGDEEWPIKQPSVSESGKRSTEATQN